MKRVNVIIAEDYEEMSQIAKERVMRTVQQKPNAVLGLATGSTMIRLYESLISAYEKGDVDFSQIIAFNLDEYVGILPTHHCSYHYFMQHYFFDHVNVAKEHMYIPNGVASDLLAECLRYEREIERAGGIDLQLLGIGQNGHIGFNEPGSKPDGKTKVVRLTEDTIRVNSRFFDDINDMPREAITVGIGTILNYSREIILMANGENKARAIQRMIEEQPHIDNPASFLQLHSNVTVIIDKEAAKLLSK